MTPDSDSDKVDGLAQAPSVVPEYVAVACNDPALGGNVIGGDPKTYHPALWSYLVQRFSIRSVLDVGCGEGHCVEFFLRLGVHAFGFDGFRRNVECAVAPIAHHDLRTGPFIMPVDLVHCCEVVEHMEERYLDHLLATLANGRVIAMTHGIPGQAGYHHVNCQPSAYWVDLLKCMGYKFLPQETEEGKTRIKATGGWTYFVQSGLLLESCCSRKESSHRKIKKPAKYLDESPEISASLGYGELGRGGKLGYGGRTISVQGGQLMHALSAHGPSHLRIPLTREFTRFACHAAINDDVPDGSVWATFLVRVDGKLYAQAHVESGDPPRFLEVLLQNGHELELEVHTDRMEMCHSVWLDPSVYCDEGDFSSVPTVIRDPLGRAEFEITTPLPQAEQCVATVVTPEFCPLLRQMLVSLRAHGQLVRTLIAVFAVECDEGVVRPLEDLGIKVIHCRKLVDANQGLKSLLYSAALAVDAPRFVCMDADMIVMGDLRPLFAALDAVPPGRILVCREGRDCWSFEHAVKTFYGGDMWEMQAIAGGRKVAETFNLVVNDGIFAADRAALLRLDGLLRRWPRAREWVDERADIGWRNQCIFNLALAHLDCGLELDPIYNVQLNTQHVEFYGPPGSPFGAKWCGRTPRVLHFNGKMRGRNKAVEWRSAFCADAVSILQKHSKS